MQEKRPLFTTQIERLLRGNALVAARSACVRTVDANRSPAHIVDALRLVGMNNEAEIANWNGPIGERWVTFQQALDSRIRPFGAIALERASIRAGMRVLDVGCGCGDLLLEAAKAVGPSGRVVGIDVSKPMLARARERIDGIDHVDLAEHDAATFRAAQPFDAAISRFGVMFFDDPVAAFANIRRAIAPGGTLAFACWQPLANNPWAAVPLAAMLRVLPAPPPTPPDAPGPFAFGDAGRVANILAAAGFTDVAIEPCVQPMQLGTSLDEAVEYASRIAPTARLLRDLDEASPVRARAIESLRSELAPLARDYQLDAAVWIVTARA